ncbi:MAG: hypothetical protein C5B48_08415 [Candidatus Rokuibacteriota bacterium]|nr:MAG: hypothetical protein C5B48_08415 [Candidatus Rokubacteria bacterium]
MHDYDRLEQETSEPKRVVNHAERWRQLEPVGVVNGPLGERIRFFCDEKRISVEALQALGTRVRIDANGGTELAWGYLHRDVVTAIKYRPLGDKPRYAAAPSVFIKPLIIGNRDSDDWFIAEGETDGCRLYDLVGDTAAVLVLPAGAKAFKPEWAAMIPRGATVHLCHDADQAGDEGATKAAAVIGGRTVRVRPPAEGCDWCDWDGQRDEFIALVRDARGQGRSYQFLPLTDFLKHPFPDAEPLLGRPGEIFLARGGLLMVYGSDGAGKSTWTIDGIIHLAAGHDWLGIHVPRPVRFCIIENEGPPGLFQQKLAAKIASWDGADPTSNIYTYTGPWGEFTFADANARAALTAFCEQHNIDVVAANPTLGLGVAASGKPDETQQFVNWLVECGLKTTRAFWLLHHENKAGQISGDWGRHPDTKAQLQKDGNKQRTKLDWAKTRWATLPSDTIAKVCLLEWLTDSQGYNVVDLDSVGASDGELEDRIAAYLAEHPLSSTTTVETEVKGTASRIRKLLESPRFDSVPGKRGAKLWLLAANQTADDTPNA